MKKLKNCKLNIKYKKSFTLIEMMIVVAIIAVLVGVALPQYNKYVRKSKTVQGINLMKEVINAELIYHAENGEFLPMRHSSSIEGKKELKKLGISINESSLFFMVKVIVCKNDSIIVWASSQGLSPAYSSFKISSVYPSANGTYVKGFVPGKYTGNLFLYDYINDTRSFEAPEECTTPL